MHAISWISFDHTVPVPVLSEGYLIARDDVPLLFHSEFNLFRWEEDALWIQWRDDTATEWDDAEADKLERVEVEGVEFFRIGTARFQFNDDTEQMHELGYRVYFVPGGGIVVDNPATPVTSQVRRAARTRPAPPARSAAPSRSRPVRWPAACAPAAPARRHGSYGRAWR